MKEDLIFIQRAYDMYEPFVDKLHEIVTMCDMEWNIRWVLYAINCVDRTDWNIEYYLFMNYWEQFISEILTIWVNENK